MLSEVDLKLFAMRWVRGTIPYCSSSEELAAAGPVVVNTR